jgi:putative ABC transport system permease protein
MNDKIVVSLNQTSPEAFKTALSQYSNIESVTAVSHVPAAGTTFGENYKRSLDDKEWTNLNYYSVDEDYLENMGLTLVAGRFFEPRAVESDKKYIVIDEMAVQRFDFKNANEALGQELILQRDSARYQVIGVVKKYQHQLLMENAQPMALINNPEQFNILQVKYSGTYAEAGKSIEAAWSNINPTLKVEYKDFYEEIHKIYEIFFGDLVSILSVISFLAIFISSLGLLGMATYTTETRIKEISIRKVLGSSDGALIYLLSKGFFMVLLIAILIAVPAAYIINNLWLEQLANHVTIDVSMILLGIVILVVFGGITIGSQTWRAAFVKPVENLKNE